MALIVPPYDYYVYVLESSKPTIYTRFTDRKHGYVFYVGKGVGFRIHYHEEEARLGHECRKCEFIRDLWDMGGWVKKRIVFIAPNETEAYRQEGLLIQKIGLHNLTNTSAGSPNYMSQEEKMILHHRRRREAEENAS